MKNKLQLSVLVVMLCAVFFTACGKEAVTNEVAQDRDGMYQMSQQGADMKNKLQLLVLVVMLCAVLLTACGKKQQPMRLHRIGTVCIRCPFCRV